MTFYTLVASRGGVKNHHNCIEHIGSIAVHELSSKAIIDIFIVVPSLEEAERWVRVFISGR